MCLKSIRTLRSLFVFGNMKDGPLLWQRSDTGGFQTGKQPISARHSGTADPCHIIISNINLLQD